MNKLLFIAQLCFKRFDVLYQLKLSCCFKLNGVKLLNTTILKSSFSSFGVVPKQESVCAFIDELNIEVLTQFSCTSQIGSLEVLELHTCLPHVYFHTSNMPLQMAKRLMAVIMMVYENKTKL